MVKIIDTTNPDNISLELLPDGLKKIRTDAAIGCPVFLYFGKNAVIEKITRTFLATEDSVYESLASVTPEIIFGSEILTTVSVQDNPLYIEGIAYYPLTEVYTRYPERVEFTPDSPIETISYDEGIIAYTISGEPVSAQKYRGETINIAVTSHTDPLGGRLAGTVSGSGTNINDILTSKSKKNPRIINDTLYYDWSYSITEY